MLLLTLACAPATCDFEAEVDGAIPGEELDCGYVADGEDGSEQWDCAIEAWNSGTSFQVRWEAFGIDSRLLYAMVGDGTTLWYLAQDQYGSEPWEVAGYECLDPYEETPEGGSYPEIACDSTAPEGNHYVVCDDPTSSGSPEPLPWPN